MYESQEAAASGSYHMQWRQRFLVQSQVNHVCRRLSSEIYACFYGITYMLSEDAFNHRMEILISSTKEGKVVINSGFYSETAMKNELNFSKLLAYLWYSANTRTLGKSLDPNLNAATICQGRESLPWSSTARRIASERSC